MPERPEAEAEPPRHLPAEAIAAGYADGPRVVHGPQPKACYVPSHDEVLMPPRDAFEGEVGYYGTLFHELVHSTGMPRRLDRPAFLGNHAAPMGSKRYAREELVAELGSVYLAGEAGLDPDVPNSAAYIDHWPGALRRDPRLLVTAAQQAQRAADWVLGRRPAAGAGGEDEAGAKAEG
jgi:antirestriction protein ArdC